MPAQERVRSDDRGQFVEGFAAERLALEGQAAALVIVQENATLAELLSQHLILSQQILDRVLLVSVDPNRPRWEAGAARAWAQSSWLTRCSRREPGRKRLRIGHLV